MALTDRDQINSAMGGSQDPNQDDYQSAMGAVNLGDLFFLTLGGEPLTLGGEYLTLGASA